MAYEPLGAPYRSAPRPVAFEPWLERAGWRSEPVAEPDALVAVHASWGDRAIGSAHIRGDGAFDPWSSLCGVRGHGAAVRVCNGKPLFVFANDARSQVEGPAGVLTLEALIAEQLVGSEGEIAMEAGLVYRTRRGEITVTAEIVAQPARLQPPRRAGAILAMLGLVITALTVGSTALAAGDVSDERIEANEPDAHRDVLMALIERSSALPTDLEPQSEQDRRLEPGAVVVAPSFVPIWAHGYSRCHEASSERPGGLSAFSCLLDESSREPVWGEGTDWIGALDHSVFRVPAVLASQRSLRGALSAAAIHRVVRRQAQDLQSCFEHGNQSVTDSSGHADIRFVIGSDGRVTEARVAENTLQASSVASCLVRAVPPWSFPPPRDRANVVVTYRFSLSHDPNTFSVMSGLCGIDLMRGASGQIDD